MNTKSLLISTFVLIFVACSEKDAITYNNDIETALQGSQQAEIADFCYKVTFPTLLKYLNSKGQNRYSAIKPLIDSGDTLAYYVQLREGWEIIAADKRLLPVIMKSECGHLDFDHIDQNFDQQIKNLLIYLKDFRNDPYDKLNPTWAIFEQPKFKNRIRPRGNGDGMWIPQDTIIDDYSDEQSQIIDTQWEQVYPWNLYTKIIDGDAAPVGCGPLAVGQVVYHFRIKDHKGCQVPTSAKYLNGSTTPQYYDFTTNGWALMEKSASTESSYRYTSVFLGYMGKQMNASYTLDETSVTSDKIGTALSSYKLTYSESNNYNFSNIYSSLVRNRPVIVCASGYKNTSNVNINHIFIISGYRTESTYARISYVWDPDHRITEWEYQHYDQSMFMQDASGNDYREDDVLLSENVYFKMNWGFSESYNKTLYGAAFNTYAYITDGQITHATNKYEVAPYWKLENVTFNTVRKIFYNIQEQY